MKFLVDAQLPPGLVKILRQHGYEAVHVADVGLLSASDAAISRYAVEGDFIIATKDADFATRHVRGTERARVLWIRLGNTTNRQLAVDLIPRLEEISGAFAKDETLIEVY